MKKFLIACFLLACTVSLIAATQQNGSLKELSGWTDAKDEVARLETLIAAAKEAGFPADPAWTARIRELLPQIKGHPGRASYNHPEKRSNSGFSAGRTVPPEPTSPLETEIRQLEFELTGGLGAQAPDPSVFAEMKERLNTLYAQRDVNRERNPLDQGSDTCPGTMVYGTPYYDSGSTVGLANNSNPISPCNPSDAPDVIYQFSPMFTSTYMISLQGSSYDTYLYVNSTGACPGIVQVGCNDDYGSLQSYLALTLNAGETYFIIVDGYFDASGSYILNITDPCEISYQGGDMLECTEQNDSTNAYYDCNGGCNDLAYSDTAMWQDVLPYQTIYGRAFTYIGPDGSDFRDTDCFSFTLTEACSLRLWMEAEFVSQMVILSPGCPWNLVAGPFVAFNPCELTVFYTACLQPGDYTLWIGPTWFRGISTFREYRAQLDIIPCSGCQIDLAAVAPITIGSTTCGQINDCPLQPSEDQIFAIGIPWASDWTFSLCSESNIWDSYLYLTSACCSDIIAEDDDGCGGIGLSVMNCVTLDRGLYYVYIEGYGSTNCGPFTLTVTECNGSCCYGDPGSPTCEIMSGSQCANLGGTFTFLEPCSTAACFTRPTCIGEALVSQPPFLPGEEGDGILSHVDNGGVQQDDYAVDTEIGNIRFWGFPVTCYGYVENFQIQFIGSSSTETYNVSAFGTQLPPVYFGQYRVSQYDAVIDPPCTLTSGFFSVAKVGDPVCRWYWSTAFNSAYDDFAFCLNAPCYAPDSLTIKWDSENLYRIDWWMPQTSMVIVYFTSDLNSVFPAGYAPYASGTVNMGHFTWGPLYLPNDVLGIVLTNECGTPVLGAPAGITLVRPAE